MAEFDGLDDIVVTTGAAFMGLTVGCCRCHDHKFDPIPQADYYRLLAFSATCGRTKTRTSPRTRRTARAAGRPGDGPALVRRSQGPGQGRSKSELEATKERQGKEAARSAKSSELDEPAARPPFGWALGVTRSGTKRPPTHVLIRGNAGTPGAEVSRHS